MQGFIDGRRADSDERSCHSDGDPHDMGVNGHIGFALYAFERVQSLTAPQLATGQMLVGDRG
jgi:hypothetical protein